MKNNKIQTFLIKFKNEIYFSDIPLFRGAVISSLPDADILYHNHTDDNEFRYKYPYIQYKRINGKAAIFCVSDGVDVIGDFFANKPHTLQLGDKVITTEIEKITPKRTLIQTWNTEFEYSLRKWIPFNSDNYKEYKILEGIGEKSQFLERILIGNLLSFAKGVGINIDNQIKCKLLHIEEPIKLIKAKGVKFMTFDVRFKTNIYLPDYIGLGKHVSIGFGTVTQIVKRN